MSFGTRTARFAAPPPMGVRVSSSKQRSVCLLSAQDNDDEKDMSSSSSSTVTRKALEQELAALQQQDDNNDSKEVEKDTKDRDLFIPVFAIVALAGLFGAYGYEMLRLYSRGELYLPGQ